MPPDGAARFRAARRASAARERGEAAAAAGTDKAGDDKENVAMTDADKANGDGAAAADADKDTAMANADEANAPIGLAATLDTIAAAEDQDQDDDDDEVLYGDLPTAAGAGVGTGEDGDGDDGELLRVHFRGWDAEEWDETVPRGSDRLSMPHTKVRDWRMQPVKIFLPNTCFRSNALHCHSYGPEAHSC